MLFCLIFFLDPFLIFAVKKKNTSIIGLFSKGVTDRSFLLI